MVLALLSGVILARLLGPEGYGQYGFAMAVAGLLSVPIELGLPQYLTRMCAVYTQRHEYSLLKGLVNQSGLVVALLGLAISILSALLVPFSEGLLVERGISAQVVYLGLTLVPILGLTAVRAGALRGLGRVILASLPDEVVRPIAFLLAVGIGVLVLGRVGFSAEAAIVAQIAASALAFIVGIWFLSASLPKGYRRLAVEKRRRLWLSESTPFLLLAGAGVLFTHIDTLMLGVFGSSADVGVYKVAAQGSNLLVIGLAVVDRVVAPHIAAEYEAGNLRAVERVLISGSRVASGLALPVAAVLILFGESLLPSLFGSSFDTGYIPLVVLTVARLIDVSFGSVHTALNMTGHALDSARGLLLAVSINFALDLILVPSYGAVGAAIATLVSLIVWDVLLYRVLRLRTGLHSWLLNLPRREDR